MRIEKKFGQYKYLETVLLIYSFISCWMSVSSLYTTIIFTIVDHQGPTKKKTIFTRIKKDNFNNLKSPLTSLLPSFTTYIKAENTLVQQGLN